MTDLDMVLGDRTFSCRGRLDTSQQAPDPLPIIVAIHGGTYTSRYFDVPGYSLLARAEAFGIPVIAIDRPGYGRTGVATADDLKQANTAAILRDAIGEIWQRHGQHRGGVVLLGHSIGGAVALRIAASRPAWPLIGVTVSGIGLAISPPNAAASASLPPVQSIELPQDVKQHMMFGPAGSFLDATRRASQAADAPASRGELIEIVTGWPPEAAATLAACQVPVQYRQAEHDALWTVTPDEIQAFANACASAPWVDAQMIRHAGHCIDFHKAGASFQLEQFAFALRCACEATPA